MTLKIDYFWPVIIQKSCHFLNLAFFSICVKQCCYLKLNIFYLYLIHFSETYPEPFVIQFGHTDTIIPLYTAFGLFNDSQKLLADNYLMNKNRTFRTSLIGPFSANLGFGLYKCDTTMAYVIRLFVNEEPVVIPACEQTSCLFSEFETYYHHLANCNVKQICEINTNMTGNSFIMSSDLFLVLLLTYLSCIMILLK